MTKDDMKKLNDFVAQLGGLLAEGEKVLAEAMKEAQRLAGDVRPHANAIVDALRGVSVSPVPAKPVAKPTQTEPTKTAAKPTASVYVNVRTHPTGVWQPLGNYKVRKVIVENGKAQIRIGKDADRGWEFDMSQPAPHWIDFKEGGPKGQKISLKQAVNLLTAT